MFRDSRCLALAANAVITCIHNGLGRHTTPYEHKRQEAHKSEHKTKHSETTVIIKSLDDYKRTSENR